MPQSSHWIVRTLGHLDGILLTLVLLLLGVSLAVVASASGQSPARISGHLINRHQPVGGGTAHLVNE